VNRAAVFALAGVALASSVTGACDVLTTIARPVMVATSFALFGVGAAGSTRSYKAWAIALVAFVLGMLGGLWLPADPLPAPGRVVTRSAGTATRGDLFAILDALDRDPAAIVGRVVSVSGEWTPPLDGSPAAVSRRVMSCCAADAVDVGFDVELAVPEKIESRRWVRVTGVVARRMRDGESRFVLERSTIGALEDRRDDAHRPVDRAHFRRYAQ
jgi:hypothetical protein